MANSYSPFDNTTQPGLFDFRDQNDILKQKADERQAKLMATLRAINPATPADRTASVLGGLIGGSIADRYNPPVLTDAEKQSTSAVDAAKQRIDAWKQNNPDATAEDLGLNTQKIMSEEFIKNGQLQQGIPLAQMYMQQAQAKRMGDKAYEQLSGEVQKQQDEHSVFDIKNHFWNAVVNGEENAREVYVDAQGNANYTDDNGQMVQKPLGQYNRVGENYKNGKFRLADTSYTPTQVGKVRDLAASVTNTAGMYARMADALSESAKANGKIDLLGKNGETQNWINDTFNAATGLFRMAGSYLGIGDSNTTMKDSSDAAKYVSGHPEIEKMMSAQNPEFARRTASERARWLAAATQLAYSRHLSLEPGAHGMSDKDFQNEILTVGSQLSDPEAFRRLSLENFKSQLDNFQFAYDNAPEGVQKLMLTPKSKARLDAAVEGFNKRYNGADFGTAQNPGPGLTGEDTVKSILGE